MNELLFSSLPISQEVLRALTDMGFEEPTPIQAQTIPHILEGKDLIGQAQTGTGKTCAFGIPLIDSADPDAKAVQSLILAPTRELAIQIADELHEVAKYKHGVRIVAVYGGQPIERQIMALKRRPQIIVGTPGRVMDHMRRKTLRFKELERIVLDEADEMLNMGFKEDIDTILAETSPEVQKVFFSATLPKAILELTERYLKEPVHAKIAAKELTIPLVEQYYLEVREANKTEVLSRLIDAENVSRALVFCNTKRRTDDLAEKLNTRGYSAEALHGDMKQGARDRVMKQFRNGKLDLLVATDVAARGLDVDDVEVVFNYDLPSDEEYYVHRIGRTGRAGRTGKSYTFVVGRELLELKNIQRSVKANITRTTVPSASLVQERRAAQVLEQASTFLKEQDLSYYYTLVDRFVENLNLQGDTETFYTTADVSAALLRQLTGNLFSERDEIEEIVPYEEFVGGGRGNNDRNSARRKATKKTEKGMERLVLNVGQKEQIRPNQIVRFLASKADISGKSIGAIAILEDCTLVDVPKELAAQTLKKANKEKLGKLVIRVERQKEPTKTTKHEKGDSEKFSSESKPPKRERKTTGRGTKED